MPNGFQGSESEWQRMARPLEALDATWREYATEHGLEFRRNERGWPNRVLAWTDDLSRKIELILADEELPTYRLNIVAWMDEGNRRYIRWKLIKDQIGAMDLEHAVGEALGPALAEVRSWVKEDLEEKLVS